MANQTIRLGCDFGDLKSRDWPVGSVDPFAERAHAINAGTRGGRGDGLAHGFQHRAGIGRRFYQDVQNASGILRKGASTGSGRKNRKLSMLKTDVFTPRPSARQATDGAHAKIGLRTSTGSLLMRLFVLGGAAFISALLPTAGGGSPVGRRRRAARR